MFVEIRHNNGSVTYKDLSDVYLSNVTCWSSKTPSQLACSSRQATPESYNQYIKSIRMCVCDCLDECAVCINVCGNKARGFMVIITRLTMHACDYKCMYMLYTSFDRMYPSRGRPGIGVPRKRDFRGGARGGQCICIPPTFFHFSYNLYVVYVYHCLIIDCVQLY